jgi:Lipase (class 3)
MNALLPVDTLKLEPGSEFAFRDLFAPFEEPTPPAATDLAALDYFHAAQWTYHRKSEKPPKPFKLIDHGYDLTAGFYAAALKVVPPGPSDQIVIAFEGTNPSSDSFRTEPVFVAAQLEADKQIYLGQVPRAFTDALAFSQRIVADAAAHGIPKENVHLTGHSLGGAEAEYVAAHLHLGGATFGAPGIVTTSQPASGDARFTNYIVQGDPVGNYSADLPDRLSNFLYRDDILHFGDIHYIGSDQGAAELDRANGLLAPDNSLAQRLEGLGILAHAAFQYHLPQAYEDALHPSVLDDRTAAPWLNQAASGATADFWA